MTLWLRVFIVGILIVAPVVAPHAIAERGGYGAEAAAISGESLDRLGTWTVRYQRVAGGDPSVAASINNIIDAEARGQVATYEPSASKTHPWTLGIDGELLFRPMTVSALFVGEYDADLPNMPIKSVATRVFDKRSGILLSWDNLFLDKRAGLARLSEQTRADMAGQFR